MQARTTPAVVLMVVSLAFAGFSYVCAGTYADLGADYTKYDETAVARHAVHRTVQVVSWAYYALAIAFFAATVRRKARFVRAASWLGIAVSAVMIGWSFLLGDRVSFDEVVAAWMGSALLLAMLVWRTGEKTASEPQATAGS